MAIGKGRGVARTNPMDIINKEMAGITQELSMGDLNRSEVSKNEAGIIDSNGININTVYEKAEEAIQLFRSRNLVRLEKEKDGDDSRDIYHLYVVGKETGDQESEVILKLPRGTSEYKFLVNMMMRMAGRSTI